MHWTQHKKYLAVFLGALVFGGLLYGGKQYLAARELARLDAMRIDGGWYAQPVDYDDYWYIVPPREIYSSGVAEGDIPALTNPKTVTPAEADAVIADDLGGISVEIHGESRFYPVQIMNWHEVVEDTLGGKRILVYYGPLTGAAVVYELPENVSFTVSDKEYNNDVLLHEVGTSVYWSGVRGTPVMSMDIADASRSLTVLASTYMTWGEWKDTHDTGTVLSTDTGYTRDYTRHPYGGYETSPGVYFPLNRSVLPVSAKTPAVLVSHDANSLLFLSDVVLFDTTPSVCDGDFCAVAFRDQLASALRVFHASFDGRALTFTRASTNTYTDAETGSTWNVFGKAIAGELLGAELTQLPSVRLYAFAADALYPSALIMGSEFVFPSDDSADAGEVTMTGEDADGATIQVVPSE